MKAYLESPVGVIEIEENDGYITSVIFVEKRPQQENPENAILDKAITQLQEYFAGNRKHFELPLKQPGTAFQQKAWNYLSTIPYGETVSYKTEAIAIGSPRGSRAVGSANGKNKLVIVVPCHRVINENGELGGFAYDMDIKRHLLEMEKHYNKNI
ncbi:methylated-DNA--[protein]-cysteine S-methyltransferase [Dysgonomonas sp. 511]|uniref:methylated-DNA--[protein]-cysteine S-methyltransferase n=1 Tax=Dysgonomonas sp. 511 TaxID=2302930 RepID=UPI0013D571EB|nr:methylated-DNA--[protein]-cysteine S-methyltransferase [Dysgonomonas sp. 511]NDV77360.1 methylated-DNA--[protein]-cysteine S-methyltransferase [Dysgonomonas sp. 511]